MTIRMIPDQNLRERFENRARELYGESGPARAIVEAVETWLARHERRTIDIEQAANNRAYRQMKAKLEQKYVGKCVAIAHGRLQAVTDTFEALKDIAPEARHRLVFRVGHLPARKERDLGWQIKMTRSVGTAPTDL